MPKTLYAVSPTGKIHIFEDGDDSILCNPHARMKNYTVYKAYPSHLDEEGDSACLVCQKNLSNRIYGMARESEKDLDYLHRTILKGRKE